MKHSKLRPSLACLSLALLAVAGLPNAGPVAAQEETAAAAPLLTIAAITVEPQKPAADTLCRLRVKIANAGDKIASRLAFGVSLNGQDLGVYGNQVFMYPVEPGSTAEISLYNFWTTETGREMPADGKLRVEVTLKEAAWTKVATETDEEGEIEVWSPIGPVENLPTSASLTLQMKSGG